MNPPRSGSRARSVANQTSVGLTGSWRIRIVRKESDWSQRVVVTGAVQTIVPGVVGATATVSGDHWSLSVEHDFGAGWRQSERVYAHPLEEHDGRGSRLVVSKDHYWAGDTSPNDLQLVLEHVGATLQVVAAPELVTTPGAGPGSPADARYLAVTVRNIGYRALGYDSVLDVTDASRDALARADVVVEETWTPEALRETGQETYGRAVGVPPLETGAQGVVHFPVRVGGAGLAEAVDVEFVLSGARGRDRRGPAERQQVRMAPSPRTGGGAPDREGSAPRTGSWPPADLVSARTRPPSGRQRPGVPAPAPGQAGATGGATG